MKNLFKNERMITDSEIRLIEPNYEGIAKVLNEFEKLYKVCENKELLDKVKELEKLAQSYVSVPC